MSSTSATEERSQATLSDPSPKSEAEASLWERYARVLVTFWFILPAIVGTSIAAMRYSRGDFEQGGSPVLNVGMSLIILVMGVLVAIGREFLALLYLLLMAAGNLATLTGFTKLTPSQVGGTGQLLLTTVFSLCAAAWIVVRRFRVGAGVRRALSTAVIVSFLTLLPQTSASLGTVVGSFVAPPAVAEVAEVGMPLHRIRLVDLSGSSVELSEPGTLYVLNFWATWCVPCREELPLLLEMFKTLPEGAPVRLVAVNTEGLDRESIETFLEKEGLQGLDVYTDPTGALDLLGTGTIPLTVVIKDRTLLTRHVGYGPDTVPSLEAEILRYLREVGPEASPPPAS